MINFIDLIASGAELQRQEHADKQVLGTLRGGNTGIYSQGERPTSCARRAMLRTWYGIDEPVDEAKRFIFDNGLNSEHQLVELLTKAVLAQGAEYSVGTQSVVGTRWVTSNGTPVTGSPDFLALKHGRPHFGCELKNMNSVYKATKVLAEKPAIDAISQAAHYSYQHGKCPWFLIYSSYTQHHNLEHIFGEGRKLFGMNRYAHLIDWGKRKAKSKLKAARDEDIAEVYEEYPKSLLGFRVAYELVWLPDDYVGIKFAGLWPDGGHRDNVPRDEVFESVVSWGGIKDYFEMCSQDPAKTWPPRPQDITMDGTPTSFDVCKGYCFWADCCKEMDKMGSKASVHILSELIRKGLR